MRNRETLEKIWKNPYILTTNLGIISMSNANKQKDAHRVWHGGKANMATSPYIF